MKAEWVSITKLAEIEEVHPSTLRRFAGLVKGYPRRINYRRHGLSMRSKVEFNLPVAKEQLRRLREKEGSTPGRPEPVPPALIDVLTEIRELKRMLAQLDVSLAARARESTPSTD